MKISYHEKIKIIDSPQIMSSKDAANILWGNWSDDLELLESFNVLFLNRANRVKGMFTASKGGVAGTVVDAKIIFAAAGKGFPRFSWQAPAKQVIPLPLPLHPHSRRRADGKTHGFSRFYNHSKQSVP